MNTATNKKMKMVLWIQWNYLYLLMANANDDDDSDTLPSCAWLLLRWFRGRQRQGQPPDDNQLTNDNKNQPS
jgi:hypothetical protein